LRIILKSSLVCTMLLVTLNWKSREKLGKALLSRSLIIDIISYLTLDIAFYILVFINWLKTFGLSRFWNKNLLIDSLSVAIVDSHTSSPVWSSSVAPMSFVKVTQARIT
jgi:hypothetical protein